MDFEKFYKESLLSKKKLVILEFGCGFNTPGVVRFRMSQMAYSHPNSNLIRINLQYPQIEEEIEENSIGIADDIYTSIKQLKKYLLE